jgi:6-phosphofructokinase 2
MHDLVTLTLNPAVDVSTSVASVSAVHKLRCSEGIWHPGGGGINVARVAQRLGSRALAVYPCGGVIGEALQSLLTQENLPQHPVPIAQETRQNFSVHETSSGQDFRFVLPGPKLTSDELDACTDAWLQHLPDSTHAVISGSLPLGVADDGYARLAQRAQAQGRRVILDASGAALQEALQVGVDLVKPSLRELSELVGHPLEDLTAWREAAASLIASHQARVVALSLGEQGALVVTRQHHWRAQAVPVTVRSTIGAGDSFLGGWLHGWRQPEPNARDDERGIENAFRWAMATAASAVSSYGTALCDPQQVQRLLSDVKIERL